MKTALFEKVVSLLKLSKHVDYHVLDFGCGNGELLGLLSRSVGESSRLIGYDTMELTILVRGPAILTSNSCATDLCATCRLQAPPSTSW